VSGSFADGDYSPDDRIAAPCFEFGTPAQSQPQNGRFVYALSQRACRRADTAQTVGGGNALDNGVEDRPDGGGRSAHDSQDVDQSRLLVERLTRLLPRGFQFDPQIYHRT
jgi:hypothetical protein